MHFLSILDLPLIMSLFCLRRILFCEFYTFQATIKTIFARPIAVTTFAYLSTRRTSWKKVARVTLYSLSIPRCSHLGALLRTDLFAGNVLVAALSAGAQTITFELPEKASFASSTP